MTPLEQYLDTLHNLRVWVKQEPKHFTTTDHVPVKYRAPMFGLTTIDDNSWLIGDRAVISRSAEPWPDTTPGLISTWQASDGAHYAIQHASDPPPASRPWKESDAPFIAHIASGSSVTMKEGPDAELPEAASKIVYCIGDAYIKMHHIVHCDSADEHVTINEVHKRLPNRSFALPKVLYHACYDDRYFLVTSKVPGEEADKLWRGLTVEDRKTFAKLIAQACLEVATITSPDLGSAIDGSVPPEGSFRESLLRPDKPDMLANCKELNFTVEAPFPFFQEDMGPTNVIIDPQNTTVGIIDWQAADFVVREWIGINFAKRINMVLSDPPEDPKKEDEAEPDEADEADEVDAGDYAFRVWEALKERGFSDDGKAWLDWATVGWRMRGLIK